jgi:hypothetical protein
MKRAFLPRDVGVGLKGEIDGLELSNTQELAPLFTPTPRCAWSRCQRLLKLAVTEGGAPNVAILPITPLRGRVDALLSSLTSDGQSPADRSRKIRGCEQAHGLPPAVRIRLAGLVASSWAGQRVRSTATRRSSLVYRRPAASLNQHPSGPGSISVNRIEVPALQAAGDARVRRTTRASIPPVGPMQSPGASAAQVSPTVESPAGREPGEVVLRLGNEDAYAGYVGARLEDNHSPRRHRAAESSRSSATEARTRPLARHLAGSAPPARCATPRSRRSR